MAEVILKLREYIFLSLKELPFIVSIGPLFLGIAEGNINLLMLFIGVAIIAPIGAGLAGFILNILFGFLNNYISFKDISWWKQPMTDVSSLLTTYTNKNIPVSVVPTYWLTMVLFFLSYLFINALSLYNQEPDKKSDPEKVNNRKSQAIISIFLIIILGITIVASKIVLHGGETLIGIIVGTSLGISLAYGWFSFLKQCGMRRLEDVFGIQARILPESSTNELPIVCN